MNTKDQKKKRWNPEIEYEYDVSGTPEQIPLIMVPKEEIMPVMLCVWEAKATGEFEPGPTGEEEPIVERELHMYIDMHFMKQKLPPDILDTLRGALGMKPLVEAQQKGHEISQKVKQNVALVEGAAVAAQKAAAPEVARILFGDKNKNNTKQ